MEADMSLLSLVARASVTVQLVMLVLLAASVLSWVIIYLKYDVLKNAREDAMRFEDQFWSGINLSDLYARIKKNTEHGSGMARIFIAGFAEYVRVHKHASNNTEMMLSGVQRSMKVALAREEEKLDAHLSMLATIGSISPYIGLFGTVWGIMRSFIALGSVQQASLAMVAPGIAEALIATAMGLFAAIPAVIAYNRYAERVDKLAISYENFAEEFATILQRQSQCLQTEGEGRCDESASGSGDQS
ncbi:MAG: protein TolQ [Gammaproteobacteria bacterium]|nr:protein TolQ [Gammaproteobacteria bacterium]